MIFEPPLQSAQFVKRYKRFLVDIIDDSGNQRTIHCPNTGSMRHCVDHVKRVWFWDSANPKRKYPETLELIETEANDLIGVNTGRANALVKEALDNQRFNCLTHDSYKAEVRYGQENSRIDFLLQHQNQRIWVEVKSVTLLESQLGEGAGYFPDAVSSRGTKHLRELTEQVRAGDRSILLFCVQHTGIKTVSVAEHIDPVYCAAFKEAINAGVEVIALGAHIDRQAIQLDKTLEIIMP